MVFKKSALVSTILLCFSGPAQSDYPMQGWNCEAGAPYQYGPENQAYPYSHDQYPPYNQGYGNMGPIYADPYADPYQQQQPFPQDYGVDPYAQQPYPPQYPMDYDGAGPYGPPSANPNAPYGPQGPQGANGPNGANGPPDGPNAPWPPYKPVQPNKNVPPRLYQTSQESLEVRLSETAKREREQEQQRQQQLMQQPQESHQRQQQQQQIRQQRGQPLKLPPREKPVYPLPNCGPEEEGYTVNFEDISVIQLINFISQISKTNYFYNKEDLNFNITLVSGAPTDVASLSGALVQILRTHNLSVVEEGNNVLIYPNQATSKVAAIITDKNVNDSCDNAIITRVFKLYNVLPEKIAAIVSKLVSPDAIVQPSIETRHLIVSDITSNVNKIAELLSALDTENLEVDVRDYTVLHGNAQSLSAYAKEILTPLANGAEVSISSAPGSQKIFIVGPPFLLDRAMSVFGALDLPLLGEEPSPYAMPGMPPPPESLLMVNNNFYMYKLKHVNGADIVAMLRDIGSHLQFVNVTNPDFVAAVSSVGWMDVNNSIVITGTDDAIIRVVALLNELDQLPKQVYIEVLILDTTLANSLDFGVQWVALGSEQDKLAFASGLIGNSGANCGFPDLQSGARAVASPPNPNVVPPAIPTPANVPLASPGSFPAATNNPITSCLAETFSLGIVGNVLTHNGRSFLTLGALLSALDAQGDSKVVLNPKIMVEDAQPANFFVGQNIPYQTTSTVIQQTGSVTQNIQYEDIGVQLQVTPTIAPNNMVSLLINQTVAELVTSTGDLTPTTNKTLSTTRVHVPDGTFLVMSGHVRDQCTYVHSGIPCLGSLPLIGPAFSRTVETRSKRNLIFFIRPKVVTNIDQGIILTNEEGYEYNRETNPCSIVECPCECAPECEIYPDPCWPPTFVPPPPASPVARDNPYIPPRGMPPADYFDGKPPLPGYEPGLPVSDYQYPPAGYLPSDMPPVESQPPYQRGPFERDYGIQSDYREYNPETGGYNPPQQQGYPQQQPGGYPPNTQDPYNPMYYPEGGYPPNYSNPDMYQQPYYDCPPNYQDPGFQPYAPYPTTPNYYSP